MRKVDDAEPPALYVYKTMVDPFAGRISFFKVISGMMKNDSYGGELRAAGVGAAGSSLRHAGPAS